MSLTAHRRHLDNCGHKDKGWNYTLCTCPIWADGKLDGKRFRRSLATTDMPLALRRIGRLERGEDQDFCPLKPARSTKEAVTAYLKDARDRNLQESSLRSITRTLTQFLEIAAVKDLPLDQVNAEHVSRFRGRREMTPRTQRKEIEYLRSFFAFCIVREWTTRNPAKLVKAPIVKNSPVLPYSKTDIEALLLACERLGSKGRSETPHVRKRARALMLTLLYTGLRISDVTQLTRAALEHNHLLLRITKNGVPLKILLNDEAAEALRKLPAPGGNPKYFFWTGNGDWETCAKTLWRTVSTVGKKAGVHAHPHRFRHTFAVELLTHEVDIRTVQQLLGHESIKTTEKHYAHFIAAHQAILDSAASLLDFTSSAVTSRPLLVSPLQKRQRNS